MLPVPLAVGQLLSGLFAGKLPPLQERLLQEPAHLLSARIKQGALSAERLCQLHIERIRQVNPLINGLAEERFEEALEEARRIDKLLGEVRAGSPRTLDQLSADERRMLDSPLLGVPISVKESIALEGMLNSCGLWTRRGVRATRDARVVASVRRLGLVPICTSNVPECTMYWADCQNKVYGRTRNPYDLGRVPGASSGGEAALLGAGATLLGIGSDIGGSLRSPAHFCGVCSHKPSPYLISAHGNWPPVEGSRLRMFTIGPMARYASDLRPLLKIMLTDNEPSDDSSESSQADHHDESTLKTSTNQATQATQTTQNTQTTARDTKPSDALVRQWRGELARKLDERVELSQLTVCYFDFGQSQLAGLQKLELEPEFMERQKELVEYLQAKFHCPVKALNPDQFMRKILIAWRCLLMAAGSENREQEYDVDELRKLLGVRSLALELLIYSLGLSRHSGESLLSCLFEGWQFPRDKTRAFALGDMCEAWAAHTKSQLEAELGETGVLVMPTLPQVAYKHNRALVKMAHTRFVCLLNVLQLPGTHVTCGLHSKLGLPYGFTLAARPLNDHLTLALAEELERHTGGWRAPGAPPVHSPTAPK